MSKERSEMRLRQLARRGKSDATIILELRESCQRLLDATNEIDLVLSIDPDAEDVLNGFVDDAYSELLPPLLKRSGSIENMRWHITPELILESAATWHKNMYDAYPTELSIHSCWQSAMMERASFVLDGHEITINYVDVDPKGQPLTSPLSQLSVFSPHDYVQEEQEEEENGDE